MAFSLSISLHNLSKYLHSLKCNDATNFSKNNNFVMDKCNAYLQDIPRSTSRNEVLWGTEEQILLWWALLFPRGWPESSWIQFCPIGYHFWLYSCFKQNLKKNMFLISCQRIYTSLKIKCILNDLWNIERHWFNYRLEIFEKL